MQEPELVRQIREVLKGARQALAGLNPDEVPHAVSPGATVLIERSLEGPSTVRNSASTTILVFDTSEREMSAKSLRALLRDFADSI